MVQSFLQIGCAQRQQRHAGQITEVHRKPESAESDRRGYVEPGGRELRLQLFQSRAEIRLDQLDYIDHMNDHQVDADAGDRLRVLLQVLRKQQQERKTEMPDQENDSYPSPTTVPPFDVPDDFRGQISGPGDEQLPKIRIG